MVRRIGHGGAIPVGIKPPTPGNSGSDAIDAGAIQFIAVEDAEHPWHRQGRGLIYAKDIPMGMGRSHEMCIGTIRCGNIVSEPAGAGQQAPILDPADGFADHDA
jgi:hypothetical protein